jgi:hypothetical protein
VLRDPYERGSGNGNRHAQHFFGQFRRHFCGQLFRRFCSLIDYSKPSK